jgi:hypothetical protein
MAVSTINTAGLASNTVAPLATSFSTIVGSAPSYACRAWVNFNGTGTPAIRGSGNVSSVTDIDVGFYQVNYTTAMPDTNYAVALSGQRPNTASSFLIGLRIATDGPYTTTSAQLVTFNSAFETIDLSSVFVSVFR